MIDVEFQDLIKVYKLACKYRRLDYHWKKQYQNCYMLFLALKNRPDYKSDTVQKAESLIIEKGLTILRATSVKKRDQDVKELDKKIQQAIDGIPKL